MPDSAQPGSWLPPALLYCQYSDEENVPGWLWGLKQTKKLTLGTASEDVWQVWVRKN